MFKIELEYLKIIGVEVMNYLEWIVFLGCWFCVLKLWFFICFYGFEGLWMCLCNYVVWVGEVCEVICVMGGFEIVIELIFSLFFFCCSGDDIM